MSKKIKNTVLPIQYVYIFMHTIMTPITSVYKIGETHTKTPKERARELSRETGVYGEWRVAHYRTVKNSIEVERTIHKRLRNYRKEKEYFEGPLEEFKEVMDEVVDGYEIYETPSKNREEEVVDEVRNDLINYKKDVDYSDPVSVMFAYIYHKRFTEGQIISRCVRLYPYESRKTLEALLDSFQDHLYSPIRERLARKGSGNILYFRATSASEILERNEIEKVKDRMKIASTLGDDWL